MILMLEIANISFQLKMHLGFDQLYRGIMFGIFLSIVDRTCRSLNDDDNDNDDSSAICIEHTCFVLFSNF